MPINASDPGWRFAYHPLVTVVDDLNVSFDYIAYYGLDRVREDGTGINVSVLDSTWTKPDALGIFGKMEQLLGPASSSSLFHGIMCATLINGVRNDKVGFLGGTAPGAFVYLVDIQHAPVFEAIRVASEKSHILSRSGSLQEYTKDTYTRIAWTHVQAQRLFDILERNDSVLLLSPGNDAFSVIGENPQTRYLEALLEHKALMRRVLMVANMRPLDPSMLATETALSRIRQLANQTTVDDALVEQQAVAQGIARGRIRAVLRKARERAAYLELPFDVDRLNAALKRASHYEHYGSEGAIVSYSAGIMRDHCVFVAGCDIYAIGEYGLMESNDGASEATPIMAGIFARFVQRHRKPGQSHADVLELFKRHYCRPLGDPAHWGLGGPDVDKMFF